MLRISICVVFSAAVASQAGAQVAVSSSSDLVRRALQSNRSIAAAQMDVQRAAARLRQAMLYPNPSFDFEQTTGRFTGAPNERGTSIGLAFPLELGGKRASRIELARAELTAAQAQFHERQRQLVSDVLGAYADALASMREVETLQQLQELDIDTRKFVDARVREGDAPPLELKLLEVEVDRLRARRAMLQGRLKAAMIRLQNLAALPRTQSIQVHPELTAPATELPSSLDAAVSAALARRPDVQVARAAEQVAAANVRLARAQTVPDVTPFARFGSERSAFDETPIGPLRDASRSLSFGVSLTLPFFNRNQGARAEAAAAVEQARRGREFVESTVRADVESAFVRLRAADEARKVFEEGVISRSTENIQTIRAAYRLGEFRVTDLIAEQRRLVDSQRDFTELLAERYRALADLQVAVGTFNPEEEKTQ